VDVESQSVTYEFQSTGNCITIITPENESNGEMAYFPPSVRDEQCIFEVRAIDGDGGKSPYSTVTITGGNTAPSFFTLPEFNGWIGRRADTGNATSSWIQGSVGISGSNTGEFNVPNSNGTDNQGNIYVADQVNHRVQKISADGKPLGWIGGISGGPFDAQSTQERCDGLTLTDCWYNGDSDGAVGRSNKANNKVGEFDIAGVVNFDQERLIVTDRGNKRIQVFDSNGKFLYSAGKSFRKGDPSLTQDGELRSSGASAIDKNHNIYFVDWGAGRVNKFDSNGDFVGWIGRIFGGTYNGQNTQQRCDDLVLPECWYKGDPDLAVSAKGFSEPGSFGMDMGNIEIFQDQLYVADPLNERIQVFTLSGKFVKEIVFPGLEPHGFDLDELGNIAFAPAKASEFYYSDSAGNILGTFGEFGTGDGQFNQSLFHIDVYDQIIYLADGKNNRMQKWEFEPNRVVSLNETYEFVLQADDIDSGDDSSLTFTCPACPSFVSIAHQINPSISRREAKISLNPLNVSEIGSYIDQEIVVEDSRGAQSIKRLSFHIVDTNYPPIISPVPNQKRQILKLITIPVSVEDDNNPNVMITCENRNNLAIQQNICQFFDSSIPGSGQFQWIPSISNLGEYEIRLLAEDSLNPSLIGVEDFKIVIEQ